MKYTTISVVMAATILIAGCGKKSPSSSTTPPPAQAGAASSLPIAQSALLDWQQGDKAAAVSSFLAADWNARPLFAAASTLSLSEAQFNAFSDAENQAKSADLFSQLDSLKQLARAVVQAGDDAADKGDIAQARKCFTSLEQCGDALDTSSGRMVKLVGQAFQKLAKSKLAKIGQ